MSIFTYSLVDAAGVKSSVPLFVDHESSLTVANLATQIVAVGGLVDAITGAQITDCRVTLLVTPDAGWKAAPIADLDMEQSLLMSYKIGTTPYSDEILIPCLRDTLIADGRPVLTAAGAIDNFRQAVESGTGLSGISIKTKLLDTLSALVSASVNFRSKRKGRKAVSKVVITS